MTVKLSFLITLTCLLIPYAPTSSLATVSISNGTITQPAQSQISDKAAKYLEKIFALYDQIFSSCGKAEDITRQDTPCNFFAAQVLETVYGLRDFVRKRSASEVRFLTAKEINIYLAESTITDELWKITSKEEAVTQANAGRPVVATTEKHVAVVIPGNSKSPQVVSMFHYDPARGKSPFRCMPCSAEKAFYGGESPKFYYRAR